MTPHLETAALSRRLISQCLPLVRVIWPGVDERSWRSYIRFFKHRAGDRAGIVTLRDAHDYVSGLAIFEVERDLCLGSVLTIHLFTAFNLGNTIGPARTLLDFITERAAALGCSDLQVRLFPEQEALGDRLRSMGLADRNALLGKRVAGRTPPR